MSHALVVVMASSLKQAEMLLSPFDEQLTVDSYEKPCHCIGTFAEKETREHFDAIYGKTTAEMWAKCQAEYPNASIDDQKLFWRDSFLPRRRKEERDYFLNHPDRFFADPECPTCKGTGKETTDYNPLAKYDYYTAGAGWADWALPAIPSDVGQTKDGITFDLPNAILTPLAGWHEKEKTWGYDSIVTEDEAILNWSQRYWDIFEDAKDTLLLPFIFNYHS